MGLIPLEHFQGQANIAAVLAPGTGLIAVADGQFSVGCAFRHRRQHVHLANQHPGDLLQAVEVLHLYNGLPPAVAGTPQLFPAGQNELVHSVL
ncbi:hypothetical protein SDC9_185964 [bioreactor metagenome]|uniref:Uncharacterized protein n=1 Tax=bioreactor metagenome TaxID=1076179 RepID=A0A645HI72_9ZZZZ